MKLRTLASFILLTAPVALAGPVGSGLPTFFGLGDLPGGDFESSPAGISGDGKTIVGYGISDNGHEAFRWTESTGMQGLGDLPGCDFYSNATSVSDDGSVVGDGGQSKECCCGSCNQWGAVDREPNRWTEATGMVALGDLPGGAYYGHMVGWGESTSGTSMSAHGTYWTEATGLQPLPEIDGGYTSSFGLDVCGNGPVIVGAVWVPDDDSHVPAYWPISTSSAVVVGDLPGGINEGVFGACSDDAAVMVG